ncbi:Hemerythrin-like domain-containing protein OS=Streptomyces glaucescens OX=1907 GN=SGLAU_15750 PE=3 SV=1 [Streptomyces glaucescens]
MIEARHPESAPVVALLREEHERIAALVEELRRVVADPADPAAVRAEVERLTTELEAHLTHEEEQLIPLLG